MRGTGLGARLRALRAKTGRGIKQVAPAVGISYTYLSKIENEGKVPSDKLVERLAKYFGQDPDALLASAGRLPADVAEILRNEPERSIALLRERFGSKQS